jgi:hypothetical protein
MAARKDYNIDYDLLLTYIPYGTEFEQQVARVSHQHNSMRAAARELGIDPKTASRAIERMKNKAAKHGYSPEYDVNHPTPGGYGVKGVSSLYDDQGQLKLQWVKTAADRDTQYEMMLAAIEGLKDDLPVYSIKKPKLPESARADLLNTYVLSDYHLGLVTYELLTHGEDWNTEKAEEVLYNWFTEAIESSPDARQCLFIQLGDFMHIENATGTTEKSGHILDHDLPTDMLIRVAIRSLHNVVHMLAQKYEHVHVMMVDGNHDGTAAKWLQEMFMYAYKDVEHITVDDNKTPYYKYIFGDNSIFAHHGHIRSVGQLGNTIAGFYRDAFGKTKRSYCHLGHFHHKRFVAEEGSIIEVEQHRTLSPRDRYAASRALGAERSSSVITYHKEFGEVRRTTVSRDMIRSYEQ